MKITPGSISLTENHMQRRRRLRRVAIPNSQALSLLGRDLREAHLQVLLGGAGHRLNNASVSNVATDPFLSSLIKNFPASEAEEISKSVVANADDTSKKKGASSHSWKTRYLSRFLFSLERFDDLKLTYQHWFPLVCSLEVNENFCIVFFFLGLERNRTTLINCSQNPFENLMQLLLFY